MAPSAIVLSTTAENESDPLNPISLPTKLPHADRTTGKVIPIDHGLQSKVDFGAEVYGIDLNKFTDADFDFISDALHKHKVLVFKEQPELLDPRQQYKLTSNFDKSQDGGGWAHGADPLLLTHNGVNIYGTARRPAIPIQPQVHILGRGELPPSHYGFPPGFSLAAIDKDKFTKPLISEEERERGLSRFHQWHFDASLYGIPPPRVGCLVAVRTPKGPDVTIQWRDGTGDEIRGKAGSTAFVAGSRGLQLLDQETRNIVLNSRIEYAPHAFKWMFPARPTFLGHSLETEEKEVPLDQLPPWTKDKVCIYPMVWTNPKTGEKSLQVHGQTALKLYLKSSPDGEEQIVDDLKEVRAFLHKVMRPNISPDYVFLRGHEEKEVTLWYNRALWHSSTEFPASYGPRVMHQCNVAASDHPVA